MQFLLTDCPFLCLRLYSTVQLICLGFLLARKADSHLAFKNWNTCEANFNFHYEILRLCGYSEVGKKL